MSKSEISFESIVPPACGLQFRYDTEVEGLYMRHMPADLNRTNMYALIDAARSLSPQTNGVLYLPSVKRHEIGISIFTRDRRINRPVIVLGVTPGHVSDFFLRGVFKLAEEIIAAYGQGRPVPGRPLAPKGKLFLPPYLQ